MSTYVLVKKHIENVKKRNSMFAKLQRRSETAAFALDNDEFKRMFALSKKNAKHLCKTLYKELAPKCGTQTSIPVEIKVLSALHYFASGRHQKAVGQESTLGVSQAAVSRYVMAVSDAICDKILDHSVAFPYKSPKATFRTVSDAICDKILVNSVAFPSPYKSSKATFREIAGFPGAIGAVGCCHIPISAPHQNSRFLNSRGQHSMNVLLVCDANMKIVFVDASSPGASLDWCVWRLSKIRSAFEAGWRQEESDAGLLLASGRFQPEPWLLTPFEDPTTEAQKAYNRRHAMALGVVVRCRSLLTSRFRCLGNLRLGPDSAEQIIKACVVLHNMCLDENLKGVDSFKEVVDLKEYHCLDGPIEESGQFVPIDDLMYDSAIRMRERVVQDHFS